MQDICVLSVSCNVYDVVFGTWHDVNFFSHPVLMKLRASVRFVPEGVVVLTNIIWNNYTNIYAGGELVW